jgi:hypothetical protein
MLLTDFRKLLLAVWPKAVCCTFKISVRNKAKPMPNKKPKLAAWVFRQIAVFMPQIAT